MFKYLNEKIFIILFINLYFIYIYISKAPEWISRGNILPAQHYVNLHYHNRRPTLLSSPLVQADICAEPIIK